mmetsp:Transcript_853/g.2750  ORF Transcript_853/g.2750 Transcript_853/m.2750 type:complete len:119 (-) Transcript_853:195-551(-)
MSDIVAAAPEVGWQEDPGVNSGDTTNDDGLFLEALHDLQSLNINADETFKRPAETRRRPSPLVPLDALSNENRRMRLAHERAYQQELRAWARGHDWVPAESRSSLLACVVSVAPHSAE